MKLMREQWYFAIVWLLLCVVVYLLIFRAIGGKEGVINAFESSSEMTRFQSSLMQEEGISAAGISIHNFYPSDPRDENSRTLSVVVRAESECLEEGEACTAYLRRIAAKTIDEYPEIDGFTHLSVAVQHHLRILFFYMNKNFGETMTIEEWRAEIGHGQEDAIANNINSRASSETGLHQRQQLEVKFMADAQKMTTEELFQWLMDADITTTADFSSAEEIQAGIYMDEFRSRERLDATGDLQVQWGTILNKYGICWGRPEASCLE
jgi:hypothetical protein